MAPVVDFTELQRAIQRNVMLADEAALSHVNESAKVPVAIRLGIYSNAYRLRLIEGLASNFPQLQAVVGDEAFASLALAYIDAHPSQHFSIRYFGSELEAYLRDAHPTQPWFAEIAKWEWALAAAFDAADVEPLTVAVLAEIDPEKWWTLRFDLHPSLQVLSLHTNAAAVFKALTSETDPPEPTTSEVAQDWLLWRRDLTTQYRSATVSEARALELVRNDATFEDLCEALCEWYSEEDVPMQAAGLLKTWMTEGLITAVR